MKPLGGKRAELASIDGNIQAWRWLLMMQVKVLFREYLTCVVCVADDTPHLFPSSGCMRLIYVV